MFVAQSVPVKPVLQVHVYPLMPSAQLPFPLQSVDCMISIIFLRMTLWCEFLA
jgi:hypothetical protein